MYRSSLRIPFLGFGEQTAKLLWRNSRLAEFGRFGAGYGVQLYDSLRNQEAWGKWEGSTKQPATSVCAYFMPSTEHKLKVPGPS